MTNKEKLKTRIVVAQSVGLTPDECVEDCVKTKDGAGVVLSVKYKGYNLVMGFVKIPTIEEARHMIKNLYLSGIELDFDEEMEAI